MSEVPAFFSAVLMVVGVFFVALPLVLLRGMLADRRRRRTWHPATAVVRRVRTENRGSGDSRRTVLVGTYEYRDRAGATHTGEGDLGDQGLAVDGSEQSIDILVDPVDGSRSQVLHRTGAGSLGCGVVVALFFGAFGLVMLVAGFTGLLR